MKKILKILNSIVKILNVIENYIIRALILSVILIVVIASFFCFFSELFHRPITQVDYIIGAIMFAILFLIGWIGSSDEPSADKKPPVESEKSPEKTRPIIPKD
jgi:hypothetical protein